MQGQWVGENTGGVLFAVAFCVAVGYAIYRYTNPRPTPSMVGLLWHALTWRLLPALRSWGEASREKAVNNYRYDMSSGDEWEDSENDAADTIATTATTQQQWIAKATTDSNDLLFQQQVEDAASMVEAGVCGETKALQIIFKVRPSSTNTRYLAARDALHAELEKRRGAPTPIAGRVSKGQFRSQAS